ncbi:MAG TPA: hypothetical protein VF455_04570 [Chryseobacterium sp.]
MKNFYLFIILLSFTSGNSQVKLNENQEKTLNLQIQNIKNLFATRDYTGLTNNISPKIIKYVYNSKDSVSKALRICYDELKQNQVTTHDTSIGIHSPVFKTKDELQCSVQMTTILKKDTFKTVSEYYLLLASTDNGKNWCFSLTDGFFRDLLDIDPKLIIPDRKLTVYENGIIIDNE